MNQHNNMNRFTLSPNALTEEFDGELIVHNVDNGKTLLLNASAAVIIDQLQFSSNIEQIITNLLKDYEIPIDTLTEEVTTTIEHLVLAGMVISQ